MSSHFSPAPNSLVLGWAPGFIGYAVSLGMSGVCAGQMVFYMKTFVNDRKSIKLVVILVFVVDLFHTYCTSALYWKLLVVCRRNDSPKCQIIPWELFTGILLACALSFIVQCFYAHRIWIITCKNRKLTGSVLVTALAQYGLGTSAAILTAQTRNAASAFTSRLEIPYSVASATCEALISGIILLYLRPGRNGVKRSNNYIQQLIVISVQMGVFNSLVAIVWLLLHFIQGGSYWTAFPAAILCKSNANSLLAVLNARKSIRSQQRNHISLIPLSTIIVSSTSS
ncbi:hypothetical protein K503DRAFT_376933 [Rhizopogon vinicolor AM-OR11-026]|uniref:DUF6534 domain-containing protein n=1 Tax=Rhizopogon vinicolor AM-OR11-026 TaxID=1314800 RepID=A0A1B7MRS7_9AGAM|nr:hypothetical protein K503DRAFT_376933 [Rhizopogon vinicolor AM-OR11-026]